MWQGGLRPLCHWGSTGISRRKGHWPTFRSCWFSSDITSSILANCLYSQLLFSHVLGATSWDYLLFTLGLCFTFWLWTIIHLAYLPDSQSALSLARFSILYSLRLFLRDAVLLFPLISFLCLCLTLNQPLLDYLHIQRLETALYILSNGHSLNICWIERQSN